MKESNNNQKGRVKHNITSCPLDHLYMKVKEKLMSEREAMAQNITDTFHEDMVVRLQSGEPVNLQCKGKPASGKSTVAGYCAAFLMGLLGRSTKQMNAFIYSDQTEFIRFLDQDMRDVAIVIDELNNLAVTGLNSTTERNLFDYFSNVFGQRNIHRISCSPTETIDRNAYGILEVIGRDLDMQITRCKYIHRDVARGGQCVLGHVDFNVRDIINKRWYKLYREKKFKRMELLTKHGVRDLREPEYAYISWLVFERLKKSATTIRPTYDLIKSVVEEVKRKEKRIYSVLVIQDIAYRAKNLLTITYELAKIERKLSKANQPERIILGDAKLLLLDIFKNAAKEEKALSDLYTEWIAIK